MDCTATTSPLYMHAETTSWKMRSMHGNLQFCHVHTAENFHVKHILAPYNYTQKECPHTSIVPLNNQNTVTDLVKL